MLQDHTRFCLKSCQNGIWGDLPNRTKSSLKSRYICIINDPINFIFHSHIIPGPHLIAHVSSLWARGCTPGLAVHTYPSCFGWVPRYSLYLLKFRVIDFTLIFSLLLYSNPFGKNFPKVFSPSWLHSARIKIMGVSFLVIAHYPFLLDILGSPLQGPQLLMASLNILQYVMSVWTFAVTLPI